MIVTGSKSILALGPWTNRHSLARLIQRLTHKISSTKVKCRPTVMVAARRAPAMTPSVLAQKLRCGTSGSSLPPDVMLSITSEPESDDVMKKISTGAMAKHDVMPDKGRVSSISTISTAMMNSPTVPPLEVRVMNIYSPAPCTVLAYLVVSLGSRGQYRLSRLDLVWMLHYAVSRKSIMPQAR